MGQESIDEENENDFVKDVLGIATDDANKSAEMPARKQSSMEN